MLSGGAAKGRGNGILGGTDGGWEWEAERGPQVTLVSVEPKRAVTQKMQRRGFCSQPDLDLAPLCPHCCDVRRLTHLSGPLFPPM